MKKMWIVGALLCAMTAAGCGGGGGESSESTSASSGAAGGGGALKAARLAMPIEGLAYRSASTSGSTDAAGMFRYKPGEETSFYVGELLLAKLAVASDTVSMKDWVPAAADEKAPAVTNRLTFLLSLDDDADPDKGVKILPASAAVFGAGSVDFARPTADFLAAYRSLLLAATTPTSAGGRDWVVPEVARRHYRGTLMYLDAFYKGSVSGTVNGDLHLWQIGKNDLSGWFIPTGAPAWREPARGFYTDDGKLIVTFEDEETVHLSGSMVGAARMEGSYSYGETASAGSWSAEMAVKELGVAPPTAAEDVQLFPLADLPAFTARYELRASMAEGLLPSQRVVKLIEACNQNRIESGLPPVTVPPASDFADADAVSNVTVTYKAGRFAEHHSGPALVTYLLDPTSAECKTLRTAHAKRVLIHNVPDNFLYQYQEKNGAPEQKDKTLFDEALFWTQHSLRNAYVPYRTPSASGPGDTPIGLPEGETCVNMAAGCYRATGPWVNYMHTAFPIFFRFSLLLDFTLVDLKMGVADARSFLRPVDLE